MAEKKPKKKYKYTKKTGRPPTTVAKAIEEAKLPDNWKDLIIIHSMEGKTEQEIRRDLCLSCGPEIKNITRLWYELQKRDDEFRETVKIAKAFREAWWASKGRDCLSDRFFQASTWIFSMKNMFPENWKDKHEIDAGIKDETWEKYRAYNVQQLMAQYNAIIGKLTKS